MTRETARVITVRFSELAFYVPRPDVLLFQQMEQLDQNLMTCYTTCESFRQLKKLVPVFEVEITPRFSNLTNEQHYATDTCRFCQCLLCAKNGEHNKYIWCNRIKVFITKKINSYLTIVIYNSDESVVTEKLLKIRKMIGSHVYRITKIKLNGH